MKRRHSADGRRSKARASRKKLDCLDVLTADEASAVLRELISSRPELIPEARQAANALLAKVSSTSIATSVFAGLLALDLDDLDAGPRAGGYIEPSEAAWAAIENVTAPYFHDLERRVKLKHEDEAAALCKGIVLGLYRAEHRGFELLEYAEDAPSELAGQAVVIWQGRRRHCSLPPAFVEKFTPEWDWLLR
jgi:hypothetical protein